MDMLSLEEDNSMTLDHASPMLLSLLRSIPLSYTTCTVPTRGYHVPEDKRARH